MFVYISHQICSDLLISTLLVALLVTEWPFAKFLLVRHCFGRMSQEFEACTVWWPLLATILSSPTNCWSGWYTNLECHQNLISLWERRLCDSWMFVWWIGMRGEEVKNLLKSQFYKTQLYQCAFGLVLSRRPLLPVYLHSMTVVTLISFEPWDVFLRGPSFRPSTPPLLS